MKEIWREYRWLWAARLIYFAMLLVEKEMSRDVGRAFAQLADKMRFEPMTKTYEGMLDGGGFPAAVIVHYITKKGVKTRRPLNPRFDLAYKSPDGFAWGYGGSGPAQLALALLADATGDDDLAINNYQTFKWAKIGPLDQNTGWRMTQDEITKWVDDETKDPRP